jgi:hypothetical protein
LTRTPRADHAPCHQQAAKGQPPAARLVVESLSVKREIQMTECSLNLPLDSRMAAVQRLWSVSQQASFVSS